MILVPGDIGFTGTRKGCQTVKQGKALYFVTETLLKISSGVVHHGDCLGGDLEFSIAVGHLNEDLINRNVPDENLYKIHVHPPIDPKDRAWCNGDVIYPEKEYLDRNKDIVNFSSHLIALSGSNQEELRSGTWSTIRYARKKNKKISIIFPSGEISDENY